MTNRNQQQTGPVRVESMPLRIAVEKSFNAKTSKGLKQVVPDWIDLHIFVHLN